MTDPQQYKFSEVEGLLLPPKADEYVHNLKACGGVSGWFVLGQTPIAELKFYWNWHLSTKKGFARIMRDLWRDALRDPVYLHTTPDQELYVQIELWTEVIQAVEAEGDVNK